MASPGGRAVVPQSEPQRRLAELLHQGEALMLAVCVSGPQAAKSAAVQASYAPARWYAGAFELLVSALAPHTPALRAEPKASVLLLGEAGAQPYARPRLSLDVRAEWPEGPEAEALVARLEANFGHIVRLLAGLPDFSPLRLRPRPDPDGRCGRLVLGFGAAHAVRSDGDGELWLDPEPLRG